MPPAPVRLRPDNFTPPTRTPWGGRRILSRFKSRGVASTPIVGESWEVSVEPSFPSRTVDDRLLASIIAAAPREWLGDDAIARFGPQTPLLVKLLDAADNLSVQVHPADGDRALGPKDSGKPEAWVVLAAEPGAGIYLGFKDGVERRQVSECLAASGPLDQLMNFVVVAPGDAFLIDAGTPHAIGAGLTLLEPQLVWPARNGVTYRFWDWNRRYDALGRLAATGEARPLHVARSLEVTRWDLGGGAEFIERCRAASRTITQGALERTSVIDWRWFQTERWAGRGELVIPASHALWAIVCVGGELTIESCAGALELGCGDSGVIPASAGELSVRARDALVFAVRT